MESWLAFVAKLAVAKLPYSTQSSASWDSPPTNVVGSPNIWARLTISSLITFRILINPEKPTMTNRFRMYTLMDRLPTSANLPAFSLALWEITSHLGSRLSRKNMIWLLIYAVLSQISKCLKGEILLKLVVKALLFLEVKRLESLWLALFTQKPTSFC